MQKLQFFLGLQSLPTILSVKKKIAYLGTRASIKRVQKIFLFKNFEKLLKFGF